MCGLVLGDDAQIVPAALAVVLQAFQILLDLVEVNLNQCGNVELKVFLLINQNYSCSESVCIKLLVNEYKRQLLYGFTRFSPIPGDPIRNKVHPNVSRTLAHLATAPRSEYRSVESGYLSMTIEQRW